MKVSYLYITVHVGFRCDLMIYIYIYKLNLMRFDEILEFQFGGLLQFVGV